MLLKRCNNQNVYPKKVLLGKDTITNSKLIVKNFNNFFTEVQPKLASEIKTPCKTFKFYLKKVDILTWISFESKQIKGSILFSANKEKSRS